MIVICTKCQAKFRVADEKIGPRGAKVRCSRCQTVFLVQRDAATPPPAPAVAPRAVVDLEPSGSAPQPPGDPFAAAPAPQQADDPFAAGDPFAAPAAASSSALLVTDLSDLLGPATPIAVPRPGGPPPLPPPLPARAARAAGAAVALETWTDPDLAPPEGSDPPEPQDGGLALEDRLTPRPMKVPPASGADASFDDALGFDPAPSFDPAPDPARDPFAAAEPFDPGSFEYAPEPGGGALALGGAAAQPARADTAPPVAAAAPARAPLARAPAPAAPAPDKRLSGQRSSRFRAVAVNAVALAALLLVALAILVVWRTEGPIDAGSLRPSALVSALRRGRGSEGPFGVHDVRSGVYERQRGAPLLFVRGNVVSRAAAPVRAVKVSVEVVRGGQVLARGEAIAGAVPTPEELFTAGDDAALARNAAAARVRAPAEVRPGDAVPFLVAIGDAPPDLEGAGIRFDLAPVTR